MEHFKLNLESDFKFDDIVVTLGNFDGFHRGHQKLILELNNVKLDKGTKNITFVALMTALICVLGPLSIPIGPCFVPRCIAFPGWVTSIFSLCIFILRSASLRSFFLELITEAWDACGRLASVTDALAQ